MLKTLVTLAAVAAAPVPSHWAETVLAKANPHVEFFDQSPVLSTAWFQRFAGLKDFDASCDGAIQSLSDVLKFEPVDAAKMGDESALNAWLPWTEEEQELFSECDEQPCKIKLNGDETEAMKAKPETGRYAQFREIVAARASAYLANRERKSYEYPGGIRDPWAEWLERKWLTETDVSVAPTISLRKLDFLSNQARAIRQVLDNRKLQAKRSFLFFNRDLYTDHYFDSWGEGVKLTCRAESKDITFEALQWVEFDLLKSTDLLSRISRPKMRQTVQEQQRKRIEDWLKRVKAKIQ